MNLLRATFYSLYCVVALYSSAVALPPDWPEDGIIVQPDMKRTPLISAFRDAKKSLKISAYKLADDELISVLAEMALRDVKIDVLVTKEIFKREKSADESETPYKKLQEVGINVHQSPDFYSQTHHKMIIVDDDYALIGTGNMAKGSFDESEERKAERDFWITVQDKDYIRELMEVFESDFNGRKTNLLNSLLVWSPDQGREPFLKLIATAKSSIWIYQQDITDKEIAHALVKAAKNGIDIRLMMMPHPFNKIVDHNIPNQEMIRQAGGKVGLIYHVVAHAKVVLVDVGMDSAQGYLGSANFYPSSLESNRELGIVTTKLLAIKRISSIFEEDWKQANFSARVNKY